MDPESESVMTQLCRTGSHARSPNRTLLTTVLLLAAFAETLSSECSADGPAAGNGLRSLLQVHSDRVLDSHSKKKSEAFALCTLQDSECFDLELDPSWKEPSAEASSIFANLDTTPIDPDQVQLVITRAGEDLRWLDALPQVTAIVYNRGGPDSLLPASRSNLIIVDQENRGREDQAMLTHIISNYDNLPDVTVFLQGWPFGHCPGLVEAVRTAIKTLINFKGKEVPWANQSAGAMDGLMPISGVFWQYNVNEGKVGLAEQMVDQYHYADPFYHAKELYNATCMKVLGGQPCPGLQWVAEGAQWAVSRDRIRFTSKEAYERASAIGEGWQDKYRGLVLEALWPRIWGAYDWMPKKVSFMADANRAYRRAHASDDYCAGIDGKRSLLFSCESRMEFCERKRHAGVNPSKQFEIERRRFEAHDGSETVPWHMMVQMEPVLWGSASWRPSVSTTEYLPKVIEVNGSFQLTPNTTDAAKEGVQLRITKSGDGYALARKSSSGDWLYLGCDGNHSKLVQQEVAWALTEELDGWVTLRNTEEDRTLTLPAQQDGAELFCLKEGVVDDQTFVLNLMERS
eukprot:gb/GFBE01011804.1/.p1 GENE.gb/GFBE01011804.1/~~gb/GFBE01011804.1/.p1  ORF type:complete len:572 (+),score=114.28 gb/GFBE01011804.1/:1-1716(+)